MPTCLRISNWCSIPCRCEQVFGCVPGTGSNPPGFHGWQRPIRLHPQPHAPRPNPCTSIASSVYSEHVGANRQRGGRPGHHAPGSRGSARTRQAAAAQSTVGGGHAAARETVGQLAAQLVRTTRAAAAGVGAHRGTRSPAPTATPTWYELALELADGGGPGAGVDGVALDAPPTAPRHRVGHLGGSGDTPGRSRTQTQLASTGRGAGEDREGRMAADAEDQAESRARPRGAPRLQHGASGAGAHPAARNPCFFLRFRLFGWKVRFTHGLLERE